MSLSRSQDGAKRSRSTLSFTFHRDGVPSSVLEVTPTSVAVGDGVLEIELWQQTAPHGTHRVLELANASFFTDLPFFHAMEDHMVMFGIQPDANKHKEWALKDIRDDRPPRGAIPTIKGLLCFSGDPGKGADSRSTLLFLTLGNTHIAYARRRPWEVPVGKVVKGLDVLEGIYTGYGDEPQIRWLDPTNTNKRPESIPGAAAYLESFPKLDRFKECKLIEGQEQVEL